MLKKVELSCFRRHEHLVVDFVEGVQLIRAGNEGGKTTVIEAVSYALFGSRALRTPLSDTVTWGQPDNALKVVLHVGDYVFSRSPKGAEVTLNGQVHVTGQVEVTNFAASLIGADAATASNLMMANQNNLRGSLEVGPKATAEMIESLADFNLFDRLIEAMQSKLLIGNPATLEEVLKQREADLAAVPVPQPFDEAAARHQIALHTQARKATETNLEAAQRELKKHEQNVVDLQHEAQEVTSLLRNLQDAEAALDRNNRALIVAEQEVEQGPDPARIEALQLDVTAAEDSKTYNEAWAWYQSIPVHVGQWSGSPESLDEGIKTVRANTADIDKSTALLSAEVATATSHITSDGTCPVCKQALPNAAEIKKHNETLELRAREANARLLLLKQERKLAIDYLTELERVSAANMKVQQGLAKYSQYLSADVAMTPPTVTWTASTVSKAPDLVQAKRLLQQALTARDVAQRAQGKVEVLKDSVAHGACRIGEIKTTLGTRPEINHNALDQAEQALNFAKARVTLTEAEISSLNMLIEFEERSITEGHDRYARECREREALEAQVGRARANLDTLHFNNTLLKKVRAARPIIADKLWGMVLSAVSTMFSAMRGENSVVTKSKDGFMVNGEYVGSLSGSTLDLLGLAIRVALVKTFLPTCPFLILDEPASAMDSNRTALMMGFLSGVGFNQIILVTHEDLSEAVANNVIEL